MAQDIPMQTEQETDAVVERIFLEWDKWIDHPRDERKESLRMMQNELHALYDAYVALRNEKGIYQNTQLMELREQIMVLDKKMRTAKSELMKTLWK